MADSIYKYLSSLPDKRVSVALSKVFERFIPRATEFTATSLVDIGAITASAAELNILDGVLATAAELNRATDVSTRIVNTTATTLAVSVTAHEGKVVTINSAAACAVTLPAATGAGNKFCFVIGTDATATAHTIKVANTTDAMTGVSVLATTATGEVTGFATTATDDTITLNGTTKGGCKGDRIEIIDVATAVFQVSIIGRATGTVVTPFSASV